MNIERADANRKGYKKPIQEIPVFRRFLEEENLTYEQWSKMQPKRSSGKSPVEILRKRLELAAAL